jgi:hypothetical protein
MVDAPNPQWDATLAARGLQAVRQLLADSSGKGAGSVVPGLGDTIDEMPLRGYAEKWCDRQEAEDWARWERIETSRHQWTRGISLLALLISLVSAVFCIWRSSE